MSLPGSGAAGDELTVVHLLRHGEVHTPGGVLYGRLPGYHLSDLGREMADRVAKHLTDADITHVVSSPLERAQETAAPAAKVPSDRGRKREKAKKSSGQTSLF